MISEVMLENAVTVQEIPEEQGVDPTDLSARVRDISKPKHLPVLVSTQTGIGLAGCVVGHGNQPMLGVCWT